MGIQTERLLILFPLAGTLLVLVPKQETEWLAAYQGFFNQIVSDTGRSKLEQLLKNQMSILPPAEREALSQGVAAFVKELFPKQKIDLSQLEKIIPDVLLILLATQPQIDIKPKTIEETAQQCLKLMYTACEAHRVHKQNESTFGPKYDQNDFFYIEWEAPGLLSRMKITTNTLALIKKEIGSQKAANKNITPSGMEWVLSQYFKLSEGTERAKNRGPLHPVSQFLTQHTTFAQAFVGTVAHVWSIEKLKKLEEAAQQFFGKNLLNLKPEIDADVILKIIDKYNLRETKYTGATDKTILISQCKRFIDIDTFIKKGPEIPEKYRPAYFLKLFVENDPLENHPSKISIGNTAEFEKYLNIDPTIIPLENKARILKHLKNPALKEQMIAHLSAEERYFIEQERFNFLPTLSKTAALSDYIFDLTLAIIQRYQLNEFLSQQNLTEAQLVDQSRNILNIAAQVNLDAKDEKYKPAMIQLALQFPDAYKYFKMNTENLKKALDIVKNRGGKSNDVVINELRCIGDKNEQKRALLALGITQIESKQVQAVYTIYQARKECFKGNQKYTAREVLQANQASRGNKNLFDFLLNSTVNKNDPELVRCMAQLPFAKNGEAVLAYYKTQGNTPSFQYLSLAAATIAREGDLLDEAELALLCDFLIAQMEKNDLTLTSDEPNITDLCDYYNSKNARAIGIILIAQRDTAKMQTYANVEKLFEEFNLQEYKDDIIAIYAYYLGYKKSTDFIYKAMKEHIKNTADVPVFYNQLKRAHFAVMAGKNKSLLKLEFQFPGASQFAAQIKELKKNRRTTFNYNERILYAIEVAKLGFDDPKDVFLFAFNHPDIAKQCIDQETYIDVISLGNQSHDVLQLRLFLRQLENTDPDSDFSDVFDNLMGKTSSTHAPMLGSSSRSNNVQNSRLSDADLKKYVTAFYLIENSHYTNVDKLALQNKLGKYLQDNNTLANLTSIKELEAQLGINTPPVINLEDNWNLIPDDEAKMYAEIFNQKINNRADLVYAFYYFANYPARTPKQATLFHALHNYVRGGSSRAAYLQITMDNDLYKETKYKNELDKLNSEATLRLEINKRVADKPTQDVLLAFFKQYNVIQTAVVNPGDWVLMHKEVSAFISNKKVKVQDVEIMVEIALRYPGLLAELPADIRGYKNLATDFAFVKDEKIQRTLIIKLCNDPHYKQTLLKELTLDRKFTAKPHHKDENKMRDELLAIHLQYGEGLSAYFRRFKDDKLNYVSAYMSVCEVAAQTQKYCNNNFTADKNEAFLIHLHWLTFKYLRTDEPSEEFIKEHKKFTIKAKENDFVNKMSLDMQIPLRNKLIELNRIDKFFDNAKNDPISAYRNYTFLYELVYKRKRTDLKNVENFTQHPVFIVFSLIRDNGFLSPREKENLYNTAFADPQKFTPEFLKLTELLGIYPLLLMNGKDRLIKKYAKELNRKIKLSNPEKLAGLSIKLDELLEVVNDKTTLVTLQQIMKSKAATALPLNVIDEAHKEYEKFIMRTFPTELQNASLTMRLQRLELASSGILEDIYETSGKDIDGVLSIHNEHNRKIAWLTQLVDSIEEVINLDNQQTLATANDYYGDEIKTIVAAISANPGFLNEARAALGLNVLSKDQLKDIEALLPNILACYAQYKDVICFYILTHTTELLDNPSGPYSHILSVAKLLEQYNINPKEYNNALMEIVFAYPLLVRTMNNPTCVKNMSYAMLEHYETRSEVLSCIQYLNSQQDIVSFIDYINKANPVDKIDIKLKNLTHYLGTLARSTLSIDEKNVLSLKLIESFKKDHVPFAKFDDSMPHIAQLAGYSYKVSADLPTNESYINSLSTQLEGLTSNATKKGLSFDAVLSCHSATKTNDQLTIRAQKLYAKNTYEADVSLDVKVISNMVNINAGSLYAHADVVENKNYSLTNEKNSLTVKVTKNEIFNMHNAQISGPADTPVQILALLTVYNEFIEDEIKAKAGVNFLHLGIIAADYQRNGLNRKMDKYYHLTNWQQQNMAAATYALLAHDSSSFDDIYKGRDKDRNLKFNAACQLYETGLALYLLETPISIYTLSNDQLVQQINFTNNMHNPQQLQSILKQLSKFNDLKQFNRGICSQKNLGLIAELFDCHYEVGKDNIATLLCKYRLGEIKTPFADQLYAQFDFLLRGIIQEEQFFEALSKCADLPANDPSAQSKLLKHYAAFAPKPSNTAHTTLTTTATVNVPKTTTFSSLAPAIIKK